MDRLALALLAISVTVNARAQPAVGVYPNPFDGLVHDTITVRNEGEVTVTLDSLRFTSALYPHQGWGWYFHLTGWFVDGMREGWVVCDPAPYYPCAVDFWGEELAPGDSLRIEHPRTYCAICRERDGMESVSFFDDTLRVYAGGHATPVEGVIMNGDAIPRAEDRASESQVMLAVRPNPTQGPATVRVHADQSGEMAMRIVDGTGRLIRTSRHVVVAGSSDLTLSVDDIAPGVYYVAVGVPGRPYLGYARFVVDR